MGDQELRHVTDTAQGVTDDLYRQVYAERFGEQPGQRPQSPEEAAADRLLEALRTLEENRDSEQRRRRRALR